MSKSHSDPLPAEEILDPISEDLRGLLKVAKGNAMTIGEIEAHLKSRGYALLVLFLAAPFPIPNIPGLSVPFGVAIMMIGFAFLMRRRPSLPHFILRKSVEFSTLNRVIPFVAKFMERIERYVKPRYKFLTRGALNTSFIGLAITSGGLFLALPLPFPLTNGPPALSIIFLVVGMLCADGLVLILGYILGIASWFYLWLWVEFGYYLWPKFQHLWVVIKGWF
jgi:hypothetical protein